MASFNNGTKGVMHRKCIDLFTDFLHGLGIVRYIPITDIVVTTNTDKDVIFASIKEVIEDLWDKIRVFNR